MIEIRDEERRLLSSEASSLSLSLPRSARRLPVLLSGLQVASAVFVCGTVSHLGNGEIGLARRCYFIYSSVVILATTPLHRAGCAISPPVSPLDTSRDTAANCPRNRCFLSYFPRLPRRGGASCLPPKGSPLSPRSLSPTVAAAPRTDRNLSSVGELSVTNYGLRCRLHSTGSSG